MGKTVSLELICRQDVSSRHGFAVLDPMAAFYQRLVQFLCYRKAVGCSVPETTLLNAAEPDPWVLPFNPFLRRDGDVAVQAKFWSPSSPVQTARPDVLHLRNSNKWNVLWFCWSDRLAGFQHFESIPGNPRKR